MAVRPRNSRARRILIVDDDPVQVGIIRGVCAKLGFEAASTTTYRDAVEAISHSRFDFITVDLSLGDHDGIELLRVVASQPVPPRVVVVSGCDERILNAAVRMAHASGLIDAVSLPKPLDLASMRDALAGDGRDVPKPKASSGRPSSPIAVDDVRRAIEAGEIYAAFQPKIDLASGRVIGCEALARWDSREFGSVAPDVFVPIAEANGLIEPLTRNILRGSLRLGGSVLKTDPAFVVAVNLSATMLSDRGLPDGIGRMLEETGTPARSLMIEVTETTAMKDVGVAMDTLLRLRIKGVGVSMDDFGTGYSSLSALARMPFNEVKIDRSFVRDCLTDPDMWKIVSSSVAIARQYGMKTVAEGIEDVETWGALSSLGCDVGQGYVFSRALPRSDFADWRSGWEARSPAPIPSRRVCAC